MNLVKSNEYPSKWITNPAGLCQLVQRIVRFYPTNDQSTKIDRRANLPLWGDVAEAEIGGRVPFHSCLGYRRAEGGRIARLIRWRALGVA